MAGSLCSKGAHIIIPLSPIDTLCREQVRICPLPSSWDCSTMKVYQQMMLCSTLEQIETIVHIRLIVAREEVYLHPCHTNLFTPGKFLFTIFCFVEAILWCRSAINPSYRRIIPYHRLYALLKGIGNSILYGFSVFHSIPFGIYQHIRQMQRNSHIDILLYYIIVVGTMIICPINP